MRARERRPRCAGGSYRTGAVLLEVLVALAILGVAAGAIVAFAVDSARTVTRSDETEADFRAANAFLEIVALWPREDLDRHLGARRQGAWTLRIEHPLPALYTAVLTDSADERELLGTQLYRRDSASVGGHDATP